MKMKMLFKLLDFSPESVKLYTDGYLLGEYNSRHYFWSHADIENLTVKIIYMSRELRELELEVK